MRNTFAADILGMSPSQRFFKNLITIRKNDIPLGFVNEILSKLVYRGRAHPC
jgi:hypothetical protein